jgi:hypothetical protein
MLYIETAECTTSRANHKAQNKTSQRKKLLSFSFHVSKVNLPADSTQALSGAILAVLAALGDYRQPSLLCYT